MSNIMFRHNRATLRNIILSTHAIMSSTLYMYTYNTMYSITTKYNSFNALRDKCSLCFNIADRQNVKRSNIAYHSTETVVLTRV
jgi:hypothetical protein